MKQCFIFNGLSKKGNEVVANIIEIDGSIWGVLSGNAVYYTMTERVLQSTSNTRNATNTTNINELELALYFIREPHQFNDNYRSPGRKKFDRIALIMPILFFLMTINIITDYF